MANILTFTPKLTPPMCGRRVDAVTFPHVVHVWPASARPGDPCRCGAHTLPSTAIIDVAVDQ
jgi:hypothetical protein